MRTVARHVLHALPAIAGAAALAVGGILAAHVPVHLFTHARAPAHAIGAASVGRGKNSVSSSTGTSSPHPSPDVGYVNNKKESKPSARASLVRWVPITSSRRAAANPAPGSRNVGGTSTTAPTSAGSNSTLPAPSTTTAVASGSTTTTLALPTTIITLPTPTTTTQPRSTTTTTQPGATTTTTTTTVPPLCLLGILCL